jgi:Tripartite tricarboxylate transporter TctB family
MTEGGGPVPDPVPSERSGPRPAADLLRLAWAAIPALIAFVLAGVFLALVGSITGPEGVYPEVLAVVVLVLGLVNLVADCAAARRDPDRADGAEVSGAGRRVFTFVLVLVAAVLLLQPLGFFPAMVVVVLGGLLVCGARRPVVLAVTTVLVIGWAYVLFERLLAVPFPPGVLGLT